MGFNYSTLLEFLLGLILPVLAVIFYVVSKKKKEIALDAAAYGFVSFLASIVAVFIAFLAANALFLNSFTFEDDTSGLTLAAVVIISMVVILFLVCETLKIYTIKKFSASETRNRCSGTGFAIGVIIAQNCIMFIALNIFNNYDMSAAYALYSGGIVCITGIMYTALAASCEVILKTGRQGPAYAISAVYYLFWISAVLCYRSTVLIYIVSSFFFVLSLVLSGIFILKRGKSRRTGGIVND